MPATINATFDTGGAPHATPLTNITDLMSNLVNSTTTPSAQAKLAKHRKGNGKSLQHSTAPPHNWHSTPTHSIGAPPAHSTGKGASPNTTAAAIKQQLQAPRHQQMRSTAGTGSPLPAAAPTWTNGPYAARTGPTPSSNTTTWPQHSASIPTATPSEQSSSALKKTRDRQQQQCLTTPHPKQSGSFGASPRAQPPSPASVGPSQSSSASAATSWSTRDNVSPPCSAAHNRPSPPPRNTPKHSASSSTSNTSATKHGSQHWNAPAKHWETGSKRSPPPRQQPYTWGWKQHV